MSSVMIFKRRNRVQPAAFRIVFLFPRTRHYDIQVGVGRGSDTLTLSIRQDTHEIGTLQSGSPPEVPAVGATGKIAELNIGLRGRFKHAAFPPGNGHRGTTKPASELHLAEAMVAAQGGNPLSPLCYATLSPGHFTSYFLYRIGYNIIVMLSRSRTQMGCSRRLKGCCHE